MSLIKNIIENKKLTKKQAQKINFKIQEPKGIQVEYYKELKKLANELKNDIRKELIPVLERTPTIDATMDSVSEILRVVNQLQNKYSNIIAFSQPLANKIVTSINRYNKNKFSKKSESQLGVDIGAILNEGNTNEILQLQIQKQMSLIKSIPEQFLKEVEIIISNGVSEGLRHEEIARQLKGIKGINSTFGKLENRVKTIARNEVENINATLNKNRQQNAGIDIYEWETSQDEAVRPSHKVMQGKYCKWSDPTVYADTLEEARAGKWKKRSSIGGVQKHPGMDYNCRCNSLAVIPDFD